MMFESAMRAQNSTEGTSLEEQDNMWDIIGTNHCTINRVNRRFTNDSNSVTDKYRTGLAVINPTLCLIFLVETCFS